MNTSGARLHGKHVHAPKCTLTLQLQAMQAVVDHGSLQQLYALPTLATFSNTFAPDFSEIVSIAEDIPELPEYACCHATPLPKVYRPICAFNRVHRDDVACKGAVCLIKLQQFLHATPRVFQSLVLLVCFYRLQLPAKTPIRHS